MIYNRISHRSEDAKVRSVCDVLEKISKRYPNGSPEYNALEEAALAYIWVSLREDLRSTYSSYKKSFIQHKSLAPQLTPAETRHLINLKMKFRPKKIETE